MSNWRDKLKHEAQELIPTTLYFFAGFQLLAFTQELMLEQYGIRVRSFFAATLGALIVAKVVIIADHFSFVNRFPNRPLIYNILWKTTIYLIGSIAVRYAEHVIHFWRQTGSFAEANRKLAEEVVWPHVLAVQIWLLVLLLVYSAAREIIAAVGRSRLMDLFFTDRRVLAEALPATTPTESPRA